MISDYSMYQCTKVLLYISSDQQINMFTVCLKSAQRYVHIVTWKRPTHEKSSNLLLAEIDLYS
jgi:hypothetical protein